MKRSLWVAGLFLLLSLVMTYPLALRLGSSVRDSGDPLLNTWILAWDMDHLVHANFVGFFDANIFYPQPKTLAYSEFLLPQAIAGLPAWFVTGNPVFVHNFIVLLAFLTTGLGMYFLARHLTGNTLASVAAGIIFAFSPFMFSHLYQVQILTAGGIPLAFLFLHKFFADEKLKDLLLFSLFFVLQALANGYYALYLVVFGGLFMAIYTIVQNKYRRPRFWFKMAACGLLIGLCLLPFFTQYYAVQKQMGFSREISSPASLKNYLATPSINDLYGRITARFSRGERDLFPGVVAFLLAGFGAVRALRFKKKERPPGLETRGFPRRTWLVLLWVVTLATIFYSAVLYILLVRGRLDLKLGSLGLLHAHSLVKVTAILAFLLAAGILLRRATGARLLSLRMDWTTPWLYLLIVILAFLFCRGASGPYFLIHKYVPGFSGVRSAARFHIFFMFGLSVLAAYGLASLGRSRARLKLRRVLLLALPVLIAVEYLSLPIPLLRVPVKSEIPEVYKWLAGQKGPLPVAELPLPVPTGRMFEAECRRVYFSSYHWKQIVNGYSGYFPPLYLEILRRYSASPTFQLVEDLRDLGVRMIIVHSAELKNPRVHPILTRLAGLTDIVREVRRFGTDIVFELLPAAPGSAAPPEGMPRKLLAREGWTARASLNTDRARAAIDGNLETRWDTGRVQEKGQWFELDLGREESFAGLTMELPGSPVDFPRGLRIEVSSDMKDWRPVLEDNSLTVPLRRLIQPGNAALDIPLAPVRARGLRLIQTSVDRQYFWSIHELELWAPK